MWRTICAWNAAHVIPAHARVALTCPWEVATLRRRPVGYAVNVQPSRPDCCMQFLDVQTTASAVCSVNLRQPGRLLSVVDRCQAR